MNNTGNQHSLFLFYYKKTQETKKNNIRDKDKIFYNSIHLVSLLTNSNIQVETDRNKIKLPSRVGVLGLDT
jgi:hypothetical protein